MDRRDFIQRFVRGGLLAGLVLIPGIFLVRRQVTTRSGCRGDLPCRRCRMLDRCNLPEAKKERDRIAASSGRHKTARVKKGEDEKG